jgi:hypothetical protein
MRPASIKAGVQSWLNERRTQHEDLKVLEGVGLVARNRSEHDRSRSYVTVVRD